ncbi:hypothetical protein EYF80_022197 [Liparis tanakae]|uniref:Uncharacterized protein n=1 Tax=Liparis tanakae TaxID=230148 RepID=A0A4Z2HR99_9TELE|nr:hypothetical protein EYF80_022197 [Liparis tanakae]
MALFLGAGDLLGLAPAGGSGVGGSERWAPAPVKPGDLCLLMRWLFTTALYDQDQSATAGLAAGVILLLVSQQPAVFEPP